MAKSPASPTKEGEFIATRRTRRRAASKPIEYPTSPMAAVDPRPSTSSGAGTSVRYRGKTGRVRKTVQKIELAQLQDMKAKMKNVEPVAAVDPGTSTSSGAGTSVRYRGKTGRVKKTVQKIELAKLQDMKAKMKNVEPVAAVDPGTSTSSGAGTSVSYRGKTGHVKKTVQKIELAQLQDMKAKMKNVKPVAAVDTRPSTSSGAGTSVSYRGKTGGVKKKVQKIELAKLQDLKAEIHVEPAAVDPEPSHIVLPSGGAVGYVRRYFESRNHRRQFVRVKKEVREKELAKLQDLKTKMLNVKRELDSMDLESHPDGDGGWQLIECLADLEQAVREQGDYVSHMLVDNDMDEHEEEKVKNGQVIEKDLSREKINTRKKGPKDGEKYKQQWNHMLDSLKRFQEGLASRPPEGQESAPPPQLETTLMPHQLHALAWLRWRETQQPCGGILADDMGLGKTITILSLVVGERNRRGGDTYYDVKKKRERVRGGTLVVCPASLAQQWQDEVRKHCEANAISVCLHHGRNRAKYAHRLAVFDLVITTYNILFRENVMDGALMEVHWHRVVLDEAHVIRNPDTATSLAVFALHGAIRWALTGTPVQNKDLDLFSLLKFLRCKPFDELAMFKQWLDKSNLGQERLNAIMSCILLRRTKIQLQNKGELTCLPSKNMVLKEVTLSKDEMDVYQKVLLFSKSLFAKFLVGKDAADKQQSPNMKMYEAIHEQMMALTGNKQVESQHILLLLLRLRQVCCHCGLIAVRDNKASGNGDLLNKLGKMSLNDKTERESDTEDVGEEQEETTITAAIRSVFSANNPVFDRGHPSSKILAVMECLRNNVFVHKDDKAVVVSQWTSVLRLVEDELTALEVRSVTLSGAVSVKARQRLVNEFNDPRSDLKVMLLSLCAGGVGLNLCGANHLLLLDPHWNPQLEEQAQDRVYRLGQTKPVNIFRFICVDTVEQSIHRLQRSKLALADCVLTGGTNGHSNLNIDIEDLKLLFNMCR